MNQPWNLARSNYRAIRELKYEVAVLPFGATEPHNLHLPYSTDTLEATIIGEKVCEAAWKQGAKVVLLPTIPFGTQTNMQEFPLALNVNPTTMTALVSDLLESVVNSGIRKILFLNSHGGNALKPIVGWFRSRQDLGVTPLRGRTRQEKGKGNATHTNPL